ncbi:hypothetical protein MASR2M44_21240 [Bacteroidota bacterium]
MELPESFPALSFFLQELKPKRKTKANAIQAGTENLIFMISLFCNITLFFLWTKILAYSQKKAARQEPISAQFILAEACRSLALAWKNMDYPCEFNTNIEK